MISFQEDLLIHGDSVYDIIDKQDHGSIQAELGRTVPQQSSSHHASSPPSLEGEHRMFLCRMNVSRNARRQMRFGDQKVKYTNRLHKSSFFFWIKNQSVIYALTICLYEFYRILCLMCRSSAWLQPLLLMFHSYVLYGFPCTH